MNNVLQAVRNYAILFLTENLSDALTFHNIEHTYEVLAAVQEISKENVLNEEDFFCITDCCMVSRLRICLLLQRS